MIARTGAIAVVLALSFGGVALAQDSPSFEDVDANKDGTISMTEAEKVENLDFSSADTDGDGMLSRDEYEAAIG